MLTDGEQILFFYRLVLVVIVVFCVCWAPIQVVLVLRAVGLYQTKSSEDYPRIIFLIFGQVLAYFNRYVIELPTYVTSICITYETSHTDFM